MTNVPVLGIDPGRKNIVTIRGCPLNQDVHNPKERQSAILTSGYYHALLSGQKHSSRKRKKKPKTSTTFDQPSFKTSNPEKIRDYVAWSTDYYKKKRKELRIPTTFQESMANLSECSQDIEPFHQRLIKTVSFVPPEPITKRVNRLTRPFLPLEAPSLIPRWGSKKGGWVVVIDAWKPS